MDGAPQYRGRRWLNTNGDGIKSTKGAAPCFSVLLLYIMPRAIAVPRPIRHCVAAEAGTYGAIR